VNLLHSDQNQDAQGPPANQLADQPIICTGLSGNELYCTAMCGYMPGNILMGNSVYSLGFVGGLASNIHSTLGGEIPQYTNMISEGRRLSLQRFEQELQDAKACAATGVTSEIIFHPGNIEFLSIGSSMYPRNQTQQSQGYTTSSADGQELFCQIDAGYQPIRLSLGNVAYSIGIGRNMLGNIRQMAHGEVTQYSDIFNTTRMTALQRLREDAKRYNANSVVGIRTTILPIGETTVQEMIMIGTASYHPALSGLCQSAGGVVTSDLTAEEMWNVAKLGYAPVELVLGTSVYSLGVMGGLKAALRGVAKGEVSSLTQLVYGAREQSLKKVQSQAKAVGADMVLGIKTYIYQLGGDLIEFLAIGTAVKRMDGITPQSSQLPPQAIIRDKDTFVNTAEVSFGTTLSHQGGVNAVSVDAKV
jgi:uncharacterized protein YbjQ (UPF0145 family)